MPFKNVRFVNYRTSESFTERYGHLAVQAIAVTGKTFKKWAYKQVRAKLARAPEAGCPMNPMKITSIHVSLLEDATLSRGENSMRDDEEVVIEDGLTVYYWVAWQYL